MKDQIIEIINNMTSDQLIELNRRYCEELNYDSGRIYINDEDFFNTFFKDNTIELARAICYGEYNFSHDYVIFNGYGNLETFNHMDTDRLVDSVETIAEEIANRIEDFEDVIRLTDEF